MSDYIVEAKNICKNYPAPHKKTVKVVDNVSFAIKKGEVLGLVGESGCGKSTVGRCILHLTEPTSGEVYYDGNLITKKNLPDYRQKMQMVFQDPYSSLDPRMTVAEIITEPMYAINPKLSENEALDRAYDLIKTVGLRKDHIMRYPHEVSGGQRQRIGIARALALNPEFIVCDEPVSALDVSVKAQIINMFGEISKDRGIAYLFITHDLLTARYISDRVAVMYLGNIVEVGNIDEVIDNPQHPYTKILFSTVALPDPKLMAEHKRIPLKGEIPSLTNVPSGCPFRTRCPIAKDICSEIKPMPESVGADHQVSCHFKGEL